MVNEQSTELKFNRLRVWNIVVGVILAAQAALMAVLTNNFSLPVNTAFMSGLPGTDRKYIALFLAMRTLDSRVPGVPNWPAVAGRG